MELGAYPILIHRQLQRAERDERHFGRREGSEPPIHQFPSCVSSKGTDMTDPSMA